MINADRKTASKEDNGLWKVRASLARNQKMPLPQRLWHSLLETRHLSRHPLMGDKGTGEFLEKLVIDYANDSANSILELLVKRIV